MFVSRWCYKSGLLKVIGQLSHDVVACKARVKLVSNYWWVVVSFDPSIGSQIKSVC